ncbi:MAG: Crp/Fnr family transcriptional regulator [Bacteroidetes bacterium]|nr:MAG: Crp/Fnr family transcriptional regulator [Bacteroidota bacterium]
MDQALRYTGCTLSMHQCRCIEKLTVEEKAFLDANSVWIKYRKSEMICKQGSFVSHVMYMEKGLAKVFLDNGVNSLVLRIIPDGNFLGLAAVSEEFSTFPYSGMAYIDSEIRQVDIQAFRQLIRQNNDFAREVIDILSSNSVQIYGRFFCLTYKQAFGRLADILLCLADRIFRNNEFDLPLTRKELAELAGMSPETVIRMLREFHEEGLIRMDGKSIEVMDYERMKKISETG